MADLSELNLLPHHRNAVDEFVRRYKDDPSNLAILLCGSLAHGTFKEESDVDIIIVTDSSSYEERKKNNKRGFCVFDICDYQGGYVDCKTVDIGFLELVAERGSDPARYAFKDCVVLTSKIDMLDDLLGRITAFPTDKKEDRKYRFAAQILAWKWFYQEAEKKRNLYLETLAVQKSVFFCSRLILNENELLYPFHKWILREVENAGRKPENFLNRADSLLKNHDVDSVNGFCLDTLSFFGIREDSLDWGNYFMKDSEQNWIDHEAPIDDL